MSTKVKTAGAGLAIVLFSSYVTPGAIAGGEPGSLHLRGTLRDFTAEHPDFPNTPSAGEGHYASNVGLALDPSGRPLHVGGGFKVVSQCQDADGNPIPWHLYGAGAGTDGLVVNGDVYIRQGTVDSFDSSQGPFGNTNTGALAVIRTNVTANGAVQVLNNADIYGQILVGPSADPDDVVSIDGNCTVTGGTGNLADPMTMPVVDEPADMGASTGDRSLGDETISGLLHVDEFRISNNKTVQVDGPTTILCETDFVMRNQSELELLPGATLDVYVKGDVSLENNTSFNVNTADPTRVTLSLLGAGTIDCANSNETYAAVAAPLGHLYVHNSAEVGGTFVLDRLTIENGAAALHVDAAGAGACTTADGAVGTAGVSSSGGITSDETFAQWFEEELGANVAGRHNIAMQSAGGGVYEYLDDAFYPADARLLGNGEDAHNYYFTYEIEGEFAHEQCAAQFVEFTGGDGAWLFVDGTLALDLGGSGVNTRQVLELDRLGLEDGVHTFKLLYAQRTQRSPMFRLRTNVQLTTETWVMVTSATD